MRKMVIVAVCLLASTFMSAQNNSDKVKVFLDCTQSSLCDFDFVRTEIRAVDFVRDRFVADVHVPLFPDLTEIADPDQSFLLISEPVFMNNDAKIKFSHGNSVLNL